MYKQVRKMGNAIRTKILHRQDIYVKMEEGDLTPGTCDHGYESRTCPIEHVVIAYPADIQWHCMGTYGWP